MYDTSQLLPCGRPVVREDLGEIWVYYNACRFRCHRKDPRRVVRQVLRRPERAVPGQDQAGRLRVPGRPTRRARSSRRRSRWTAADSTSTSTRGGASSGPRSSTPRLSTPCPGCRCPTATRFGTTIWPGSSRGEIGAPRPATGRCGCASSSASPSCTPSGWVSGPDANWQADCARRTRHGTTGRYEAPLCCRRERRQGADARRHRSQGGRLPPGGQGPLPDDRHEDGLQQVAHRHPVLRGARPKPGGARVHLRRPGHPRHLRLRGRLLPVHLPPGPPTTPRTGTTRSSGRRACRGRPARLAPSAAPTTAGRSGSSPTRSRRTWRP